MGAQESWPRAPACSGIPNVSHVPLVFAAELEFVEITIIVVVVMVMVVVITCLLSHYKLSARSFIGRHSQSRRREDALSSVSA